MPTKVSKFLSTVYGHQLWLLGFAVALLLLGARWRLLNLDGYSGPIDEHLIPITVSLKGPGYPPILAYWISGSQGDSKRILRLLKAIYHPRNQYLLHLDAASSNHERTELALSAQSQKEFHAFGNVYVVGRSYAVNQMAASGLAAMLHAAALFLRINADWDWFTTLSISDYPLLTQDDILYAFTSLRRDLNFIHCTNKTHMKEQQIANHIIVDTSLHYKKNGPTYFAVEQRGMPDAFKMYRGWFTVDDIEQIFHRALREWIGQPSGKLLMYSSNVAFPLESYFHTLCNSPEFQNATVSLDLRYIIPQTIVKSDSLSANISHNYEEIISSPAIFARPFKEGDPVLEEIDRNIINRPPDGVIPGKWCVHRSTNKSTDYHQDGREHYCSIWDDIDSVQPGNSGLKLKALLSELAQRKTLMTDQCHGFV